MSKVYYKESTVRAWLHDIIRAMNADGWRPDYIVGLTRGGLVPATMLSHYLDVPMHALKVSLRDDNMVQNQTYGWLKMHLVMTQRR
jgi:hypoxanthine phosphoribosyltransferase